MVTIQSRCMGAFPLPPALFVVPSGTYLNIDPDSGEEHSGTYKFKRGLLLEQKEARALRRHGLGARPVHLKCICTTRVRLLFHLLSSPFSSGDPPFACSLAGEFHWASCHRLTPEAMCNLGLVQESHGWVLEWPT